MSPRFVLVVVIERGMILVVDHPPAAVGRMSLARVAEVSCVAASSWCAPGRTLTQSDGSRPTEWNHSSATEVRQDSEPRPPADERVGRP